VYHRSPYLPDAATGRTFGPLYRFDPQRPGSCGPVDDPDGRSVLYVGADLATSASEVFGEVGEASLCPAWRVALLRPTGQRRLFDLTAPGTAMAIGALPAVADGPYPRKLTQQWARAIYEDDPTGVHVDGIRYRSAYNGGIALALWDSYGSVGVVSSAGRPQDVALREPAMFARLVTAMTVRRITISLIPSQRCPRCA
jgi:hypothetical protein